MRVPRYEHPVFACQYDLSEGDTSHLRDREWYAERLIRALSGPARGSSAGSVVLELGAGTGRITRRLIADVPAIARGGTPLLAIDVARPMLRRLVRAAPTARALCADMTRLPIRRGTAGAVLAGYNVFGCLLEPGDLTACARGIARALRPGGRLLFDVAIHHEEDHPEGPRRFDWTHWRDATGLVIRRRTRLTHDHRRRRLDLVYEFAWRMPGGREARRTVDFALNTWPIETYEAALGEVDVEVCGREERTFEGPGGRRRMWAFVEAVRH